MQKACLKNLSNQLKQQSNVELFKSDKNYFRFVYTSSLMRFKDDLEIYIDPKKDGIQVRSSSRTGYSDLGVNRERVEEIRKRLPLICK